MTLRAPGDSPPDSRPAPVPLLEPREGIPPVTATDGALDGIVAAFAAGTGPVAVDAERASGYRYGQRAYLVQLRREGAGSALIDPVGCPDLSALGEAIGDAEWVLHAATQDLPCLRDIGMVPSRLFDTELAGRLAGFARVGLGAMVENVLGFALEKGHSAVDWSTRPLPEPWLRYAALDVELLVDLRDALEEELEQQGKLEWARQEFAAIAAAPPPPPRKDPWRRTSGMHKVRRRRQMAVVRELWTARDQVAQRRDISPARCSGTPRSWRRRCICRRTATPWPHCRASATVWAAGSWSSGRPPSTAPAPWPRTSCRSPASRSTGRRRPAPGPTRTRSPRPGCRPPARRSPRSPRP